MKKLLATAGIAALGMSVAAYAQNTALRVGAAKVDVTPSAKELPKTFDGILDHIYSRAIVIDNGSSTAALISVDAGGVPDAIWQAVSKQLESDLGIPAKNVLLTATHSHSVPGQQAGPYTQKIVESVRLARPESGWRLLVQAMARALPTSTSTAISSTRRRGGGGRGQTMTDHRTRPSPSLSSKILTVNPSRCTTTTPCTAWPRANLTW